MRRGALRGACGFGLGGALGNLLTGLVVGFYPQILLFDPQTPYYLIIVLTGLIISNAGAGAIGAWSLHMGRRATIGFGVAFGVALSVALPIVVLALIGLQAVGTTPGPGLHFFTAIAVLGTAFGIVGAIGGAFVREPRGMIGVGFGGFAIGGLAGGLVIVAEFALTFSRVLSPSISGLYGALLLGLTAPYVIGGAIFGNALSRMNPRAN